MRPERIHVLFFTPSLGLGGAEKHLLRLANHLDRARFRVSVAVVRAGGSYERELSGDVALHPLAGGRMLRAAGPLHALVSRMRPDVVCSFHDHANAVAILATRRLGVRPAVVAGVQNPFADLRGPPHRLRKRAVLAALPLLYPHADRVVALSTGVFREVEALSPRLRGRVALIPNAGLDPQVPARAAEPVAGLPPVNGPVVVACGRLTEQKGHRHLIDAIRIVRERVPASLWVLGEGTFARSCRRTRSGWGSPTTCTSSASATTPTRSCARPTCSRSRRCTRASGT
jgi:glycosyltransferase involved in cell wall biosynthesis